MMLSPPQPPKRRRLTPAIAIIVGSIALSVAFLIGGMRTPPDPGPSPADTVATGSPLFVPPPNGNAANTYSLVKQAWNDSTAADQEAICKLYRISPSAVKGIWSDGAVDNGASWVALDMILAEAC